MNKINKIRTCFFVLTGVMLMHVNSCTTDEEIAPQKVTDIDGNVYNTVTIGTQVWMVENLKVTRYRNGDSIGTTNPCTKDISSEESPKYQWSYDGNENNVDTYGRLYTWYAVNDNRNVCPKGWHVPTDAEWSTLTDFVTNNSYGVAGKALAATSGWDTSAIAGTIGNDQLQNNTSGFTGLPGGKRGNDGKNGFFSLKGKESKWWSASEDQGGGCGRSMGYDEGGISYIISAKNDGRSVRCLKD